MKRFIKVILPALLVFSLFTSCIADEPLNAECDITGVDTSSIANAQKILVGNPIVSNNAVSITIKRGTDRTAFAPQFYLSEGTTITHKIGEDGVDSPIDETLFDFTIPQIYTTHSQDGKWHKDYKVSFVYPILPRSMTFERHEAEAKGRYHNFYEEDVNRDGELCTMNWSTGNAGYALTGMGKVPADYPTAYDENGHDGGCIKLVTRSTGSFGDGVNMPIAAGNIFIGEFKSAQAMLFPRKATQFGLQILEGKKPVRLEGYYKYVRGEQFTDKNKNIHPELVDTADIYAVVYECDPNKFTPLNGDNVLSSNRIVLMARIDHPIDFRDNSEYGVNGKTEPTEWNLFSEEFKPMNGKTFDLERCQNDGYAIAVVMTSSRQGAYFEGAVGSTLWVDDVRVVCE